MHTLEVYIEMIFDAMKSEKCAPERLNVTVSGEILLDRDDAHFRQDACYFNWI